MPPAVPQIAREMLEVNQTFRDLGVLVEGQSASIVKIEENLERTTTHMERGVQELHKAAEHNKSCVVM